jgi:hypothetical protein
MSIGLRCTNLVRFDPQQGKYLACGHEFSVKDDLAGSRVRCPKCGEPVEVAPATTPQPPAPAADSPAPQQADYPDVLDDDEFRLEDPIEKPAPALPAVEAQPSVAPAPPELKPAPAPEEPAEEKAPCPGCGRPLSVQSVICTSCGYHKGLHRRVDDFVETEEEEPPKPGFERWLRRHLVEGDDPEALRSLLIVAGLFLVACGACLFVVVGHLIWILVAVVGLAAAGAWLGWWRIDPWRWLLLANRAIQWRHPSSPTTPRTVLDLRDMPITDKELTELKNLEDFEVLDLEGTAVSDQGLPALYDYKNLRCIVLCETQTTEQGAARLQQALPKASIWR